MVVINHLIKIRYIIPIDLINAILVAKCFIKHVFKLHGLPNCRNVSHVTWSRDHEARLANLTLEQPLTSRQQSTTNFNTAYVPL